MMRTFVSLCISLSALVHQLALAETVYKCQIADKTTYSQAPCADATPSTSNRTKTLEVNDARSPEQREQSQAAVKAQANAAEALESRRVATEAKDAKRLAEQQAAAARAERTAKAADPVVIQPIVVVRPSSRAVVHVAPVTPQKPYCHLSALRCN